MAATNMSVWRPRDASLRPLVDKSDTVVAALLLLLLLLPLFGCQSSGDSTGADTASSAAPRAVGSVEQIPGGIVLPPKVPPITNPLELPAPTEQPAAEDGQRVFAVPEEMLRGARLGSAMKLASATAIGREGENLIVRIGFGAPYQVHPAYVVVPRVPKRRRIRPGTYIIASYNGELRHGVVKNLVKNRVNVRFTDLGVKRPDQRLDPKRIGVLSAGLAPGGYAAHLAEHEYRHVLLVSASPGNGKQRWLVIRSTGETDLVSADKLKALPVSRFKPRVGASLLAAWRGTMVRTQVKSLDRPSLLTVTRPRAGRPLVVGPGMVMPTE